MVVLVHGQPGQAADWRDVAEVLESSHRVLVPDRPGYGPSGSNVSSGDWLAPWNWV